MHSNYRAEFTPTVNPSIIPRFHPLELVSFVGLFKNRAWDRLFFNESYYNEYSQKEIEDSNNPFKHLDLTTESGRTAFEKEIRRYTKLYPGMIVKEGEEYDFEAYYIKSAMESQTDLSSFDKKKVAAVMAAQERYVQELRQLIEPQPEMIDPHQGQLKLGSVLPEWVMGKKDKALM